MHLMHGEGGSEKVEGGRERVGEKYWEFDINKKDTGDNEKRKKDRGRLKCKYKNGNGEESLKKNNREKKNWMKQ